MGRLRRLISVTFATAVAIGGALVFVPVACLVDPVTRSAGFALTEYALSVLSEDFPVGPADSDLVLFGCFVWGAAVLVCALPVIVVALVGEMTGTRGLLWYAGATAFAAAFAPWVIRATLHLPRATGYNFAELRFGLIFFFGGLISGWFIGLLLAVTRETVCDGRTLAGSLAVRYWGRAVADWPASHYGPAVAGGSLETNGIGASPSGKAADFDSAMRRFESSRPSQMISNTYAK